MMPPGALAGLFARPRPLDAVVALERGLPLRFGTFARGAAAVAGSCAGGGRWVLACEDPFALAAGLFGLVLAGCTPVLPPNHLPGTLDPLRADAAGVITGLPGLAPDAPLPQGLPLADVPVEFWTSGSTGAPKRVERRFLQLETEVRLLDGLFGERLGSGPVAGTVPHHHIYGLLFRILWPLAMGRPFITETCGDPSRFRTLMAQRPCPALISSPAHLARLPRLMEMDGMELPAVFSSGGALDRSDALAWRAWAPSGVVEIYGSTESGGIGWRNPGPDPASSLWTPFPDAVLDCAGDGAILLASSRIGPEGLRMEDGAELGADGRFQLLGRLDRVVKIEEKRISLPQVEQALEALPEVRSAAVVLLDGPRRTLGGVVVLESAADAGDPAARRRLEERFREHLARSFEGPAIPRRWRFLEELPRDARGKLLPGELAGLF